MNAVRGAEVAEANMLGSEARVSANASHHLASSSCRGIDRRRWLPVMKPRVKEMIMPCRSKLAVAIGMVLPGVAYRHLRNAKARHEGQRF